MASTMAMIAPQSTTPSIATLPLGRMSPRNMKANSLQYSAGNPSFILLRSSKTISTSGRNSGCGAIVAMCKSPSSSIGDVLQESIKEAEEVCAAEGGSGECAAAWDGVEEISATISHKKQDGSAESKDPLEKFCKDVPEADECGF